MPIYLITIYLVGVILFGYLFSRKFPTKTKSITDVISCLIIGVLWPIPVTLSLTFVIIVPEVVLSFWLAPKK